MKLIFSRHCHSQSPALCLRLLTTLALLAMSSASHAQTTSPATAHPLQAATFGAFAPRVKLHWDDKFLAIESNGLPAHGMMVGITAWQQQVPMPQNYRSENAWRLPLNPQPAPHSQTIKGHFLRGAIAIAANGIPIFNPQNNRGEISQEIGELDQWGGHCGRADDYHYHAAPLHLQSIVGDGKPIAYALDGYPIYGLTDPDGVAPTKLDECNGHSTIPLGYHYHASTSYPYVNGGFHGEVIERQGQVDPQPQAQNLRHAMPPLQGAEIIAFKTAMDEKSFTLKYQLNGKIAAVNYLTLDDATWKFQYIATDGSRREEYYSEQDHRATAPQDDPPTGPRNEHPEGLDRRPPPPVNSQPISSFILSSSEVANGGNLPIEFTGDGACATLPLAWSGAPAGTMSYALIMHHLDREGVYKWYWTLYDIPADVTSLAKNVTGIGKLGTGFKGQIGYEPPHSKGPGPKTYTLTLYALSAPARITVPPSQINRETLLAAIQGSILASAELNVIYSSKVPAAPSK